MSRILLMVVITLSIWTALIAQSDMRSPLQPEASTPQGWTLLGFRLGKNTLDDVRAKFGESKVRKCSSEEEASNEICYSGRDGTRVVFESGFSGGWTKLDGYKIISAQLNPQCYRECPLATVVNENVRATDGLGLGLSRRQVVRLLGKPTHANGNKLTFERQSRLPMTKEEAEKAGKTLSAQAKEVYWDVLDAIEVNLWNGKVVELAVRHTVTD